MRLQLPLRAQTLREDECIARLEFVCKYKVFIVNMHVYMCGRLAQQRFLEVSEPPWQLHVLLFYLRTQVDEENWRVQADLEALKEMICTLRPKSLFG